MKSKKNTALKFILDIFYPNRCPCCGSFIKWDKLICSKCHKAINIVYDKTCKICGKEICICSEGIFYNGAVVPLRYGDLCRQGILSLKKGNNKNFGEYTGKLISSIMLKEHNDEKFDFIIPVPMSRTSMRSRGYNQAEVISAEISDALNIPVRNDILYKKDTSSSQHFLGRAARFKNISAIKINDINLSGKSIIICDDVITTGSTVNRCAGLLKSAGAEKVFLAASAQSKMK